MKLFLAFSVYNEEAPLWISGKLARIESWFDKQNKYEAIVVLMYELNKRQDNFNDHFYFQKTIPNTQTRLLPPPPTFDNLCDLLATYKRAPTIVETSKETKLKR